MGAVAVVDSAADRWPVQADVVVESVGRRRGTGRCVP